MKPGLRKVAALILATATLFGSGASAVSAAYADDTTMGTSTRIQTEPDVKTTTGGDEAATKPDTGAPRSGPRPAASSTLTLFAPSSFLWRLHMADRQTPLTECPVDTSAPFGDGTSDDESGSKPEAKTESKSDDVVTIDGKDYCSDTKVESATDDWNGVAIAVARRRRKAVTARRPVPAPLASNGAGTGPAIAVAGLLAMAGASLLAAVARTRRHGADPDGLTAD